MIVRAVLPPMAPGMPNRMAELKIDSRRGDLYTFPGGTLELDKVDHNRFLNLKNQRPVQGLIRWVLATHAGTPRTDHASVTRTA